MASEQICCTEHFMFKGDHRTFKLTVKDQAGAVVNLTGSVLVFTLKIDAADVAVLVSKSSTVVGEITITAPLLGEAEIYLVPGDTSGLEPGSYMFDVQLTTPASKVHTLLKGVLVLEQDVTN